MTFENMIGPGLTVLFAGFAAYLTIRITMAEVRVTLKNQKEVMDEMKKDIKEIQRRYVQRRDCPYSGRGDEGECKRHDAE